MLTFATTSSNTNDARADFHPKLALPASLRAKENITLLALALILSLAYIVQQSIRQRVSEKRAFERKRRLLGISTTAAPNPSAFSHAASSIAEGKDAALSTRAISSIGRHAWALSQVLHLDACVQYVQEKSPSTLKRLFEQNTRRRKDTVIANGASDAAATSTSVKDTRGRAGTVNAIPRSTPSSSSPPQANSKAALPTLSHTPNSPHSPAGRQSARTAQGRHASGNANGSSSSSRSRSSTQTSRAQQQRTSHPAPDSTGMQANQPVMKSVGIQVSFVELSDSHGSSPTQQNARPQGKGKKARAGASSSDPQSPDTSLVLPNSVQDQTADLETASYTRLPSDNGSFDTSGDDSRKHGISNELTHTLSRNGTITNRTSRSMSRSIAKNLSVTSAHIGSSPPTRSNTKESVQSPTCSSSGRSTSLSVSTDATDMTSLRDYQEASTMSSTAAAASESALSNGDTAPSQSQQILQPAVSLVPPKTNHAKHSPQDISVESSLQKSPVGKANILSYSFHTGFQEPTTLEEGEIDEFAGPMTSSPSQSRRQDGTHTSGYPSIPIPSSTSSASSSAFNSPSSARRAISVPRQSDFPSSSTLPQSPVIERRPENAQFHQNLQNGMYPSSLSVQSPNMYGFMPTSPPPRAGMQHQRQTSPGGMFGRNAIFHGPGQSSPQAQSAFAQQQQQIHHYIAQAQYPYQHLLLQQQSHPATSLNGHMHAGHPHTHSSAGPQSPAQATRSSSGLLNPMHAHPHGVQGAAGGRSSSGGSNRSSVHLVSPSQLSSRSTSPQPSWAHSLSDAQEGSTGASTAPTEADSNSQLFPSQQQQQQFVNGPGQIQQVHGQNQMDFVQKMMLMQAQIQFAMQQNEVQSQHAQAQVQAQAQAQAEHHFFQSAAGPSVASTGVPLTPLSPGGHGLPSPYLYTEGQQQNHSPFLLNGLASPLTSGMYHHQPPVEGRVSPGVTFPHQQYPLQYHQHQHAGGVWPSTSSAGDRSTSFPTVRRRQSTPALGADATISSFSASQGFASGSSFSNGKRRNRRNSRISRMPSYGQALDSPDHLSSPNHDTSAQYDAEVDMSGTSSSYNPSHRPNHDRRRSSLIPPASPLLNPRRERRSRQKEREREKARQMERDDEDVTNNEDDIKADLELLNQMQDKEDKGQEISLSTDDTMKRIKSMETVLERRGKELEIARWKLKCVEVDRRNIEAEVSLASC